MTLQDKGAFHGWIQSYLTYRNLRVSSIVSCKIRINDEGGASRPKTTTKKTSWTALAVAINGLLMPVCRHRFPAMFACCFELTKSLRDLFQTN